MRVTAPGVPPSVRLRRAKKASKACPLGSSIGTPAIVPRRAGSTSGTEDGPTDGARALLIVAQFSDAGRACSPTAGSGGAEGAVVGGASLSPKLATRRGRSLAVE